MTKVNEETPKNQISFSINGKPYVAEEGMTMIVVTHELEFAKDIATDVLFMDKGVIVESGTPDEIFNHPKTERLKEFLSKIK